MARKKKPTNIHKLQGTFQPCRHAGDEVPVSDVVSPIPLNEKEQHYFDYYSDMFLRQNLSTELDAVSIALLSQATVDYIHHREGAREEGALAVSDKGVEYLSGRHNAMAAALKRINHYISKFGMTPVDRTGLECGESSGEDEFDELFKRSMN